MKNIGYYNGVTGIIEDIKIPMLDRGMYFGDGVYEATFAVGDVIFAIEDHLNRLYNSAKLIDINIPYNKKELEEILCKLTRKVDGEYKFIYWQITRGTDMRSHSYEENIKGNLYITITPFSNIKKLNTRLKVITVEDTRFLHCNIKTLNLIPNVMAAQKAKLCGCDEAIFHRGNIVTEAAHSNVHILKNGVFKTHPTDNLILPGISRKHIIEICNNIGVKVDETAFTIDEMMNADEILISSSSKLILPVESIDGIQCGGKDKSLVKRIQQEYLKKVDLETLSK